MRGRHAVTGCSLLLVGCSGWGGQLAMRAPSRAAPRAAAPRCLLDAVIDLESPAPAGPDPYKLVGDDLDYIKKSIKGVLKGSKAGTGAISSNEVLSMAAREFMQRKGKSFRPMLVLLIGRATDPDFVTDNRHSKLAVICEMIHTASLIHADVLEDNEQDEDAGTLVHQEVALDVGNKVCILAGDFLLAKAAVELSLLDSAPVTEIIAQGLEAICEGGMTAFNDAGADGAADADGALPRHLASIDASVAELIANACQCSAILSGHERGSIVAQACHAYGTQLAMARQLVTEADEVEAAVRKCRRNPAKLMGLLPSVQSRKARAPLLIAAQGSAAMHALLHDDAPDDATAAAAIEHLDRSGAIDATRQLAADHAQAAADSLGALPNSETRDALFVLCHKVLTSSPIK